MGETRKSKLPHDPDYWDALARRIREDAAGPLATYRTAQDVWYGVLARRAPWLVAASVAAMLILWLIQPPAGSSATLRWMERSLAPTELAGSLMGGSEPPTVNVLMVEFPLAPEERRP